MTTSSPKINGIFLQAINGIANPGFVNGIPGYFLKDEFTTDQSAPITSRDADYIGAWSGLDPDSKISVASSNLTLVGQANQDKPQLYFTAATRASGVIFKASLKANTSGNFIMAFYDDPTGAYRIIHGIGIVGATVCTSENLGFVATLNMGAITNATYYECAVVLRASGALYFIKGGTQFGNWTLLCSRFSDTTASCFPNLYAFTNTQSHLYAYARRPTRLFPVTTGIIASDAFSGTWPTMDGIGHRGSGNTSEAVAGVKTWSGSTWSLSSGKAINTPNAGTENCSDTGFADAAQWTAGANWAVAGNVGTATGASTTLANDAGVPGGTAAVVGTWYVCVITTTGITGGSITIGTGGAAGPAITTNTTTTHVVRATSNAKPVISATGFTGVVDNFSVKPLTLSELFATFDASEDKTISKFFPVPVAGTQVGVVFNLDSASNPQNFCISYHNGTNAVVDECVAGVYGNLISGAAAIGGSPGSREQEVVADGTKVSLYFNRTLIGTVETARTANTNTLHGLFSTYSGATINDYTCRDRGTDTNVYAILDDL